MKKRLLAIAAAALLLQVSTASANTDVTLHEDFASGAVFNGTLTFSNNYDTLLGATGLLTGGTYGTENINWTWWNGNGWPATAIDYDGIPNTYEDWLMNGAPPDNWSTYIGISWYFPVGSQGLTLALSPAASIYNAGINGSPDDSTVGDPAVRYQVGAIPEPESYAMLLAGLGLLGFAARRRKQ
jgi:hypothetical protein